MKKILVAMLLYFINLQIYAAFPTNTSTKLINIDKNVSDFNDFYFKWRGWEDQYIIFNITNNANNVALTGYYATFKVVGRNSSGSNVVYILKQTNEVKVANKQISFTVSHTNIPYNAEYKAELLLCTTNSNMIRSLARGRILVEESLYQYNDATFPYPSITYLTKTQGDSYYEKKGGNTVVDGYVLTARTNASGYITRWEAIGSSSGGTLTNVSVAGGILTGGGGGSSTTITLTTNAVRNAIKENLNANGLTGTIANALLDIDLQRLANNDGGSLTNLNITESDPKWTNQSNLIFEMAENGQTAYGWGNHATNGYLKSESDTLDSVVARGSTITGSGAKGMTRTSGAGNSFYIKMDTGGEDSWLEIGYPSMAGISWLGTNAVTLVSHGGTKPIGFAGSKLDWNQGEFTLYDNGNIDGHNAVWSNATINANSYQWNGTNLVNWRQGSIGGTASVYFVINGTNYHIRVK